jgi:nucleoside-diphosphate-sugar epimerase
VREPGCWTTTAPYCAGWNGCWTGRCRFGQLSTAGRVTRAKAQAVFAAEHIMTSAVSDPCLDRHKRLVYTGGCFDWGDRGEEMITELTPLSPSPMGQGHAREAAALQRLHDERGLDVVRLNPGYVYGHGGLLKTAFTDQARLTDVITDAMRIK